MHIEGKIQNYQGQNETWSWRRETPSCCSFARKNQRWRGVNWEADAPSWSDQGIRGDCIVEIKRLSLRDLWEDAGEAKSQHTPLWAWMLYVWSKELGSYPQAAAAAASLLESLGLGVCSWIPGLQAWMRFYSGLLEAHFTVRVCYHSDSCNSSDQKVPVS